MNKLTSTEIKNALLSLDGWNVKNDGIIKNFVFNDFRQAMDVMIKIGKVAEEMNHHPEWSNVYNKLDIRLNTHDAGGITQLDIDFAIEIEKIVNS